MMGLYTSLGSRTKKLTHSGSEADFFSETAQERVPPLERNQRNQQGNMSQAHNESTEHTYTSEKEIEEEPYSAALSRL